MTLKRLLVTIYKITASRRLSNLTLFGLTLMVAVWLIPFQIYGVPGWQVSNIATKSTLFIITYVLFFLNLILCLTQTVPFIIKKVKNYPIDEINALYYKVLKPEALSDTLPSLTRYFSGQGYIVHSGDNMLTVYKGRYSPWGTFILHISFILLLAGALLTFKLGFFAEAVVTEGQFFNSHTPELYINFTGAREDRPLDLTKVEEFSFMLNKVEPVFWKDKFLFTDLYADITYPADTMANSMRLRLNRPMFIKGKILLIKGFGYAPQAEVKDNKGNLLFKGTVNLSVFPSGNEDYFKVEGLPYEIHVILWSDYYVKNGQPASKSLNLKNPAFTTYIIDNNKKLYFNGLLKPYNKARFADYTLTFTGVKYFAHFHYVNDPGAYVVFLSMLTGITGLCWRFVFYRKQLQIEVLPGENRLRWGIYAEFFKEHNCRKFKRLLENWQRELKQ